MKKIKLKIHSSGLGPKVFVNRLCDSLTANFPVRVVDRREHIYLSCVWGGSDKFKKSIWVHRADGVYFDKARSGRTVMNKRIRKTIQRCDAVIFQSEFSKKICAGVIDSTKEEHRIIYNGCDPEFYNNVPENKMGYKKMLVACARWVPLKRPMSIVRGFINADLDDTVLVMIGKIRDEKRIDHPNVKYLGSIKPSETYKYYANCDGVIHISRLDACPNAVVEALCAGKPVLTNNVGGTRELVQDDGIIIDIDPVYNYTAFKMKKVDKIDTQKVSQGMKDLLSREWSIDRPDLHIDHVAKQYYNYFRYLIQNKC
jgi:glycosyltransferase involved in cell wall biosynthesis